MDTGTAVVWDLSGNTCSTKPRHQFRNWSVGGVENSLQMLITRSGSKGLVESMRSENELTTESKRIRWMNGRAVVSSMSETSVFV
jgi:hypothetical protein